MSRPFTAAIQNDPPWTPLMSTDCASSGTFASARPNGSQGKPSCGSHSVIFSQATQVTGRRIAIGHRVARRAATSVPTAPAVSADITNSAPK
ncbi:MAG: hypothetical protein HOQ12_09970 [Gemmatimonadaceae bacterium]|nr:hypothetical protein [Gemmatimonadaceae bacterium]